VCVNGDGGFQLNIQELSTVAKLKLPIKYFILNNDGYGSIKNTQRNYFNGNYVASGPDSGVVLPDMMKVAGAFGISAVKISNQEKLGDKIKEILSMPGPVICDVMIDPTEPTSPKLTSQVKSDGTIVSKPMEDLWPFLDREEFKANMVIKTLNE
jgi:acetolactate synthase-1/2/3 large subunit